MENNREMFARIAEYGDTWEAREQQMLSGLTKKVELAAAYKNAVVAVELGDSEDIIKSKLDASYHTLTAQFSPEIVQTVVVAEAVSQEFRKLHDKKQAIEKEKLEDKSENEHLEKELNELEQKGRALLKSYDVGFLLIIKKSIDELMEKNKKIRLYLSNQEQMLSDVAELIPGKNSQKFLAMKPVSVDYQPFSVNITLEPDDYKTLGHDFRRSDGLHFRGTTFNMIKNNPEEVKRRTAKHENNHNFLDTISTMGYPHPFEKLTHCFEQKNNAQLTDEQRAEYKKELLEATPVTVIDWMHEEILAAAFSEDNGGFLKNRDLTTKPRTRVHKFGLATSGFSTAGSDARKIVKLFRDQAALTENEDIKDILVKFDVQFKGLFILSTAFINNP